MEKLLISRTNPVQTKPVEVKFIADGETIAVGSFPFPLWLQFEKLIKEGLEWRQRQDPKNPRISVTFEATQEVEKPEPALRPTEKVAKLRGE